MRDLKIDNDPDFILAPKYENSLKKLLEVNPDGVSDSDICKMLQISPKQLKIINENAIIKLRTLFQKDMKSR